MGLGDKAAAFRLIEREMAIVPIEKDAIDGPGWIDILARVAARLGATRPWIAFTETDFRCHPLARWLYSCRSRPRCSGSNPMFDPLRNDARFLKLCEEKQP
jgi:hypothetical protein